MFLACVANVSDGVITKKVEEVGGEKRELCFSLPPSLCFAFIQLCRRTRVETLATQATMFLPVNTPDGLPTKLALVRNNALPFHHFCAGLDNTSYLATPTVLFLSGIQQVHH